MPMSLKCMIDKWLYKGQISQEEYDAVIKKLDGHDRQIREEAIDSELMNDIYMSRTKQTYQEGINKGRADAIEEFYNKLRDLKLQIKAHIEIENVYKQLKEQK